MPFVGLFLLAKFVVYSGFFMGVARLVRVGTPQDALWAAFHRTWLGAAATLAVLVFYMVSKVAGMPPEQSRPLGSVAIWIFRATVWTMATIWVYRETRWRRKKLAVVVILGLVLNAGIDFALVRLEGSGGSFMPSFGYWDFRIC